MTDLKTEIKRPPVDTSPEAVKKTGNAFLFACTLIGAILFLVISHTAGGADWNWVRGFEARSWKWMAGAGATLFIASRIAYPLMKPVHTVWMKFAWRLGWLTSGLVLTIYFFFVITPVGVIMRLAGKDFLNEKPDPSADTYWVKREKETIRKRDLERLF